MKLREIETQLRKILPLQNSYFNDWTSLVSYEVSSNVATLTTSTAHNLSVSDSVYIKDVVYPNTITSLTSSLGVGTAVLSYPTDYTYPFNETITISGANESDYNDTFNIISITDRTTITFEITLDAPATATGSPVLLESDLRRINGEFTVATVPTDTTFTVAVTSSDFTAPSGGSFSNLADIRITGEISVDRILDVYSKQSTVTDWWLFVVAELSNANKDKNITSDFDFTFSAGDYFRQQTAESITVYVVVPTQTVVSPVEAQDICRNELKRDLIKTLGGFFPAKLFYNSYEGLFYQVDSMYSYNRSYYIHQYTFSATVNITMEDIYVPDSAPVKLIYFKHIDETGDLKTTDTIDLETT